MRLLHYSAEPLVLPIHSRSQTDRAIRRGDKPDGFWVSVEGECDWPSWCRSENFATERLVVVSEIVLAASANILILDSEYAVRRLTRDFGKENRHTHRREDIDWPAIAERWQGIVIAPYQWRCRLDGATSWYYTWDCASGCIWDASAIAAVSAVARKEAA